LSGAGLTRESETPWAIANGQAGTTLLKTQARKPYNQNLLVQPCLITIQKTTVVWLVALVILSFAVSVNETIVPGATGGFPERTQVSELVVMVSHWGLPDVVQV
jgi:hypothetical protein